MPESRTTGSACDAVIETTDEESLRSILRDCERDRRSCVAIGRGSRSGWGAPIADESIRISMAAWRGVTRFAPEDLTCGVHVGTPWQELLETVEAEGLTLEAGPFADPQSRTVGGVFGEAPPSSRGHDRGSLRSQVLGMTAMDGRGRVFHSGGQVVKNVAGYDLCKLFVGSGGAWFVATELQLRLTPMPRSAALCRSETMTRERAAQLWLATRREVAELRACDLVLEESDSAHVEYLVAGNPDMVASIARRDGFTRQFEDREAWHRPLRALTTPVVLRGRAMASGISQFVAWIPSDATGRVAMQGAFELGCTKMPVTAADPRNIVRAIRGAASAHSSTASIDARLKQMFGTMIAPTRSSFDTHLDASRDRATTQGQSN